MSLDNTSQPGTPGPADLVPSRYALRVGEIDVLVVSDGVLSMSTPMLATNADPAVRAAWLDDMFLPPDKMVLPLNEVVVRSGGRTILIDAGLGVDYQEYAPRAGRWGLRLEAAGIDLASVTDVVLTHMHFDHVGGLLVDGVKDRLRPDLRIHAAAAEAEFWASPDFSRTALPAPMRDQMSSSAKRFLNEYGSQLRPFEAENEVAPGVLVRRTGGHTPGHSVVRLASGGDRLTFAADAVLPAGFDHPDWHNGFEHDPEEAARVRVRLLRELAETREPMVATHLPFPSVCHVTVAGDVFRWVPAFWEY
jgi:glyoxylase-like metal-dependent hydrolase (beta-lactamase superfamily II)